MIRIAAVLIWLFALPLQAEVYPALHDVTGVSADDVLNIRAAPDAGAGIVGTLAPDATGVEVVSVTGGWALVNMDETSGYVAMRFLSRTNAADWNRLEVPLTCLGTEPFWSLQIDPPAGETRFQTPEDAGPRVAAMAVRWPGLPSSPSAAVALPDGIAVLTPAECSDGMSDRTYGISLDIFRNGSDGQRLSGCCRLGLP